MVELTAKEAIARMRSDEMRLNSLQQEMQSMLRALEEARLTRITLEQLPAKESNALIPLGGTFIPAKLNPSIVNVNIGSGVVIEATKAEAIAAVKKREMLIEQNLGQMQAVGNKLSADVMDIRQKLSANAKADDMPVISG